MKDKLGQEPAFASHTRLLNEDVYQPGLSTRLLLAGMAMQGLMANSEFPNIGADTIAKWSFEQADELLRQESLSCEPSSKVVQSSNFGGGATDVTPAAVFSFFGMSN